MSDTDTGTQTNTDEILSFRQSFEMHNGYYTYTFTFQGKYQTLVGKAKQYYIGYRFSDGEKIGEADVGKGIVCSSQCVRRTGGLGELVLSVAKYNTEASRWFISLEFLAVNKNIRTWTREEESDSDTGDDNGTDETKVDLVKLSAWEGLKTTDPENYNNFNYKDTDGQFYKLENDTLELAKMIFKGIETYTIHTPTITVTFYNDYSSLEVLGNVDKVYDTTALASLLNSHKMGDTLWDVVLDETGAKEWLMTECRNIQQANGLMQCTARWVGGEAIEKNLYPKV